MPKLFKTDAADIYKILNGIYFALTDKGNFIVIQKGDKHFIEAYDGTLNEACIDYEVSRPIYIGLRCPAGYFKNLEER